MIKLKKADNSDFFLNPMLIEHIIESPDTVITLTNGKKYLVKDKLPVILEKITDFWHAVHNLDAKVKYLEEFSRQQLT